MRYGVIGWLVLTAGVFAQSSAPSPPPALRFEVASIKPSQNEPGGAPQ